MVRLLDDSWFSKRKQITLTFLGDCNYFGWKTQNMFETKDITAVHDNPTKNRKKFNKDELTRVVCIIMDTKELDFILPSIHLKNKFMKAMIWLMKLKKK